MPPGSFGKTALRAMPVRLEDSPNGHGFAALWVEFPSDPLRAAAQCSVPKRFAFSAQNTVPPFRAGQLCPFFMSWNGKRPPLVFLHAEPEASIREQSAAAPVVFHAKPGNFYQERVRRGSATVSRPVYKSLGKERGGVWGGEREAFLQKGSLSPPQVHKILKTPVSSQ